MKKIVIILLCMCLAGCVNNNKTPPELDTIKKGTYGERFFHAMYHKFNGLLNVDTDANEDNNIKDNKKMKTPEVEK